MPLKTYLQQNIARRVLISFFLFSFLLTTASTVFILSTQYFNEKSGILTNSQKLISAQVGSLSQVLWNVDKPLAKISIDSLLNTANFTYIAIYNEEGDLFVSTGSESKNYSDFIKSPLFFKNKFIEKEIKIGFIKAYISTDSAKQHMLDNTLNIVLIQTLKSVITSIVFLLLIYHIVIRHIHSLTKHIATEPLNTPLKLDRTYKEDELQFLVDTINKSRKDRHKDIKAIKKEKARLEKEVFERKKVEAKAQASQEQLLYVLNSLTKSVFFCKADGEVLFMNHMALKLLNHHDAACSTTDTPLFLNNIVSFTESNDKNSKIIDLKSHDGKFVSTFNAYHIPPNDRTSLTPVKINIIPTKTNHRSLQAGFIVLISDQTKQEKLEKMSYIATHDYLTKTYNRLHITTEIEKIIKSNDENYSLALLDLDKFKNVNDTCGHRAGDLLLKKVAQTIQETLDSNDILARIGGDEFAILFHSDQLASKITAQNIITRIENINFTYNELVLPISCSIGITNITSSDKKLSSIFARADHACYQVKNNGRGNVEIYKHAVRKLKLTS